MTVEEKFQRLVEIMARLRSEHGCPWDREQTHESLRQYLLEETYEVLETIDQGDDGELCLELGDVLLQIIFHAQIAQESGRFDIGAVIDAITDKMIRRHPHVFADAKVKSAEEQTRLWEQLKKNEGKESVIDGVPRALPALQRAARLQQKAGTPPCDWQSLEQRIDEFRAQTAASDNDRHSHHKRSLQKSFGDLLFSLVSLGRGLGLNAEDELRQACERFSRAFRMDDG